MQFTKFFKKKPKQPEQHKTLIKGKVVTHTEEENVAIDAYWEQKVKKINKAVVTKAK